MRAGRVRLLITLALVPLLACAAAPEPTAPRPPTCTTAVRGSIPDLVGRWLVVADVTQPRSGQHGMSVVTFWEVTAADGKPSLVVRWMKLPQPLQDALDAANKEMHPWEPTPRDLQELGDAWSTLEPIDSGAATVETSITGNDAFSDVMKADEKMKDARFLIQMVVNFLPGAGRPIRDVLLYGAMASIPAGWRGNYTSASIAGAPVPVPITLEGSFRAYRLEAVPGPNLYERVLDIFSGCGRKSGG